MAKAQKAERVRVPRLSPTIVAGRLAAVSELEDERASEARGHTPVRVRLPPAAYAVVAELADAPDQESGVGNNVWVRLPPTAMRDECPWNYMVSIHRSRVRIPPGLFGKQETRSSVVEQDVSQILVVTQF